MVKYLTSVKQKVSTDTHTVTTQASSVDVGQANVSTDAPSNYRHHESRYVGQISSDCEHIPAAVSPVQATIIAETSTVQTHPHQYPAFAYSPVIPTIDARSIR